MKSVFFFLKTLARQWVQPKIPRGQNLANLRTPKPPHTGFLLPSGHRRQSIRLFFTDAVSGGSKTPTWLLLPRLYLLPVLGTYNNSVSYMSIQPQYISELFFIPSKKVNFTTSHFHRPTNSTPTKSQAGWRKATSNFGYAIEWLLLRKRADSWPRFESMW